MTFRMTFWMTFRMKLRMTLRMIFTTWDSYKRRTWGLEGYFKGSTRGQGV